MRVSLSLSVFQPCYTFSFPFSSHPLFFCSVFRSVFGRSHSKDQHTGSWLNSGCVVEYVGRSSRTSFKLAGSLAKQSLRGSTLHPCAICSNEKSSSGASKGCFEDFLPSTRCCACTPASSRHFCPPGNTVEWRGKVAVITRRRSDSRGGARSSKQNFIAARTLECAERHGDLGNFADAVR